jgi:hypothetical protein
MPAELLRPLEHYEAVLGGGRGDSYRLRTKRRAGLVNQASANTEATTN